MKRELRLQLRRTWLIRMGVAGLVFFPVALAAIAHQLGQLPLAPAQKLTALLLSLPLLPWIVQLLPAGPSPLLMPWVHLITIVAVIPFALCAWRFHHHRTSFRDEEKAREMKDI